MGYAFSFKHIGINEGLSQLSVMSIHQDRLGRMWFGTEEGLNMYDGQRIKVFKPRYKIDAHSMEGEYGVLGNNNYPIVEDSLGNIFFCSDESLIQFNLTQQTFDKIRVGNVRTVTSYNGEVWFAARDSIFKLSDNKPHFVYRMPVSNKINCLHIGANELWIGTNAGAHRVNGSGKYSTLIRNSDILSFFRDSQQNVWIATLNDGAYRVDSTLQTTRFTHQKDNHNSLASNSVRCFEEDADGIIWIGTFKGLNSFNPRSEEFTLYTSGGKHDLSHSSIFSLCKDRQNNIWVGTYYGGVNYFSPTHSIFSYYSEKELNFPFVGSMTEDEQQNLWVCTEGGGLTCFNRLIGDFKHYDISWLDNGKLQYHNNLKAICYEPTSERVFIGTHTGGLSAYHIRTKTFKHYYLQPGYAARLGNVIDNLAIHGDKLIIQVRGGIFCMDLNTEQFTPLFNDTYFSNLWIRTFAIDSQDYIWIAGYSHLLRINMKNPKDRKLFQQGKNGLGKFYITKIIEGPGQEIYVGTRGSGLYRYDTNSDSFQAYTQANGSLLSDYCYDIAISPNGNLIITSNQGVTLFNPTENRPNFIGIGNNMPISGINIGCKVYVAKDKAIFIGGVDGLIAFKEEELQTRRIDKRLYFSNLIVNNQEVFPGDEHHILSQTMPLAERIDLTHTQGTFTLQFASTNYVSDPQSGIFEYKLEGLEEQWNTTSQTSVSYSNLSPGKYKLFVREKNTGNLPYTQQECSLDIEVHPAFYQTTLAYGIYLLIILGITVAFVRFYYSRMKLKAVLEAERAGKMQMEELNRAKINFFTTVSHEFRTPLTLILSQIELLLQGTGLAPKIYSQLSKVHKNALSMQELITELLTFQRLEQSSMVLKIKEFNLHDFLDEIYRSFADYAKAEKFSYEFNCPNRELMCWGDPVQLRKVFYNLLGNAFKYGKRPNGKVELAVSETNDTIMIQCIDNGSGISPEEQQKIFDIFYRVNDSSTPNNFSAGSGIGLSLVKKITEAHHGSITVSSQLNYGSIFSVTLKKGKEHFNNDHTEVIVEEEQAGESLQPQLPTSPKEEMEQETGSDSLPTADRKYKILIVEDNEEMRNVLRTLFMPIYQVLMANDGKEGLQLAINEQPDLILSDIMMPNMSGKELCTHVKNNVELCHIPVVLLTALDSEQDKLAGLSQRADDYISKPFNAKQLIVRCNNLIYNREQLKKKFSKKGDDQNSHILATNPLDEKFLQQVDKAIKDNLDKEDFDINQLAQTVGISRSSLYAKFKALSGIAPNEYLILQRLKHAAKLLEERPDLQVSEISYQVGFGSPRYFSKCFKEMYAVSPLEYRKSKQSGQQS